MEQKWGSDLQALILSLPLEIPLCHGSGSTDAHGPGSTHRRAGVEEESVAGVDLDVGVKSAAPLDFGTFVTALAVVEDEGLVPGKGDLDNRHAAVLTSVVHVLHPAILGVRRAARHALVTLAAGATVVVCRAFHGERIVQGVFGPLPPRSGIPSTSRSEGGHVGVFPLERVIRVGH